jgi:lysophospholipase L1-like esterase
MSRLWLVIGLLGSVLISGSPAPASAQSGGDLSHFSWSAPSRFGHRSGGRRVVDYAQSAAQVVHAPFKILAVLQPAACNAGVTLRWTIDGQPAAATPVHGRCAVELSFARERSYEVTLDAEVDARHETTTQQITVQDFLIVSIGDSVASGEGNPINRHPSHPTWDDRRCHRSSFAGTAQVADAIEKADSHSSVTFVNLACSGATVPAGVTGGYRGVQAGPRPRPRLLAAQLDELGEIGRLREIDAVLMSVGANDIGFGKIVTICARPGRLCYLRKMSPRRLGLGDGARDSLAGLARRALDQLPQRYAAADAALPTYLPRDRVFAIEYFDPTHTAPETFCDRILLGVSRAELQWAYDDVVKPLNAEFSRAAGEHGWQYVDGIEAAFAAHGYCNGENRWVVTLRGSLSQGSNLEGTLHPNEEGHVQTAELINAVLRPALLPGGKPRAPDPSQPGAVVPADSQDDRDVIAAGAVAIAPMVWGLAALRRRRPRLR